MSEEKMSRQEKKERQIEQIQKLMDENNGIVKTSQLYSLGLDYRRIQVFVEYGILERIKNGYYAMNYRQKSEEELILSLFSDSVLSMESALYYYHYLSEKPYRWTIAVDKNTSKSRFKIEYPLVHPYYTEPEVMTLGTIKIPFGNGEMNIYCKERLICDVLKYEDRMDKTNLQKALRAFLTDKEKDIAALLDYARERKVLSKVRNQIGVWL